MSYVTLFFLVYFLTGGELFCSEELLRTLPATCPGDESPRLATTPSAHVRRFEDNPNDFQHSQSPELSTNETVSPSSRRAMLDRLKSPCHSVAAPATISTQENGLKKKSHSLDRHSADDRSSEAEEYDPVTHTEEFLNKLKAAAHDMQFSTVYTLINKLSAAGLYDVSLPNGWPFIFAAIKDNALTLAISLLRKSINVVSRDKEGRSALIFALQCKKESFYHLCIEQGVPLAIQDKWGRTVVHYAAKLGLNDLVLTLLEKQPSLLDQQDNEGYTPLMAAILNDHAETAILLLNKGADAVMIADRNGCTGIHHIAASRRCASQTLCAQVEYTDAAQLNQPDRQQQTPFTIALRKGNHEVINWLDSQGVSALVDAARCPSLLELAIDVNFADFFYLAIPYETELLTTHGTTPLMYAASKSLYLFCQRLVEAKASVHAIDAEGNTPLHVAAQRGKTALCRLFIENGAQVNARNKQGQTPLHCAVMHEQYDMAPFLVHAGADTLSIDCLGRSCAILIGGKEDIPIRFKPCPVCDTHHWLNSESFICDVRRGAVDNVRYHIKNNFLIVDERAPDGTHPLVIAVNNNDIPMVHLLVMNAVYWNGIQEARLVASETGVKEISSILY